MSGRVGRTFPAFSLAVAYLSDLAQLLVMERSMSHQGQAQVRCTARLVLDLFEFLGFHTVQLFSWT